MNDSELKKILNLLETPEPRPEFRQKALRAAMKALGEDPATDESTPPASPAPVVPFAPWRMVILGAAACFVLIAVVIFLPQNPDESLSSPIAAASSLEYADWDEHRVFDEIERLFPGQLAYLVIENGESHLQIDEEIRAGAERGEPLVLRLRSGGKELQLTSFSGQQIEFFFHDRHFTIELLLSGRDEVILVADDFIWTSSQPFPLQGVQASAGLLRES